MIWQGLPIATHCQNKRQNSSSGAITARCLLVRTGLLSELLLLSPSATSTEQDTFESLSAVQKEKQHSEGGEERLVLLDREYLSAFAGYAQGSLLLVRGMSLSKAGVLVCSAMPSKLSVVQVYEGNRPISDYFPAVGFSSNNP